MAVLDDVKILLGFAPEDVQWSDVTLTSRLNLIIKNAESRVLSYLPHEIKAVPVSLEYIVTEIAVARFNRIGNEGMSAYSQEGESITYGDDISPYLPAIQAWNEHQKESTKGRVRFL